MAIAVQADSLSSITSLAANPPKYPRNITQEARRPLVLYIARVPGSKDVFLTTLKPRQKVVTAEDVASSLYYLHVDQPAEEISLDELSVEEHKPGGGGKGVEVSRKPVPSLTPTAAAAADSDWAPELPVRPTKTNLESQRDVRSDGNRSAVSNKNDTPGATIIPKNIQATKRKPVGTEEKNARSSLDQNMDIKRRPLGPRPENSWPVAARSSRLPGLENMRAQAGFVDGQVPPLPARPGILANRPQPYGEQQSLKSSWQQQARGFDSATATRTRTPQILTSPAGRTTSDPDTSGRTRSESLSSLSDAKRFSITLIRRDPASGAQWNVGQICSTEECETRSSPSRYVIRIEITNPGYSQFLRSKKPITVSQAAAYDDGNHGLSSNSNVESGSEEVVFRRQVLGEYMNSWLLRNPWKRRSGSSEFKRNSTEDVNSTIPRVKDYIEPGMLQSGSTTSTSSPRRSPNNHDGFESAKSRDKGYTFLSPWDGTCEFFTGASGRSLKCKHTIVSTTSSGASQSANVSELRFSLPPILSFSSSASSFPNPGIVTTGGNKENNNNNDDHESSTTSHNFRKRLSTQMVAPVLNLVNENAHRLDLSLGQEKAGGGNRGKKAKLGKLIVGDEGLKMLDLIVAANMGIWWRAYDKIGACGD
ncbi:MAG: hypothetical protein M1816_006756 [Peltula sp. TS41687]|nr:MAG: hypothetical protein M1816_006756 [Peltula sp. TS41687]